MSINQPSCSLSSAMIAAYGRIVVQLDAPLVSIIVNVQKPVSRNRLRFPTYVFEATNFPLRLRWFEATRSS